MKVINSKHVNPFGGINFVFEEFDSLGLGGFFNQQLPALAPQSVYDWKDIIYSFFSIYFCGGSHIEDIGEKLKNNLDGNPFCKIPSPDRILDRFKELSGDFKTCRTKRGVVEHQYCTNNLLQNVNIKLLKLLNVFDEPVLTLDYDNTIIFNEKKDSVMTYKKQYGYQPGVCTVNTKNILYIENRNGNSDAKSFQHETLGRMFEALTSNGVRKANNFRADGASYQFDVIKVVENSVDHFYISVRNSYVECYYNQISNWQKAKDEKGDEIEIGDVLYAPFQNKNSHNELAHKYYRLVVKRKKNITGQTNIATNDDYEYRAIITNNFDEESAQVIYFYNQRGAMEKEFDVVKNDFGWNKMSFSNQTRNLVFLYLSAMCKNLYRHVITEFSEKFDNINPTDRMRRFVFTFITIPAKWTRRSGQNILRIYGAVSFKT